MRSILICVLIAAATARPSEEHQPEAATAGSDNISISVNAESFTRLPSQWPDYFGTHYAGSPEGVGRWWNTVRKAYVAPLATAGNGGCITMILAR